MAKTTEKPAADQSPAADLLLKFRDTVFTSRTLIIPATGRTLLVAKREVSVSVSDEQAVSYLKANEEFEPME
ncbi:hypothetical protein [Pseudomonas sp. LjRoot263]|uniref:hypothetical protein n=1 Tax=Pseudomonas sp. LjRoot263 TaxID=3342302 RepID=UPI003ECCA329